MNKFIIVSLLIATSAARAVLGAADNGAHVGHSGGSVEYEFAYVARTIDAYAAPCAAASACALTDEERATAERLRAGAARGLSEALRFGSPRTQAGFPDALYTIQGELVLVNIDRLYLQDAAGAWSSLPHRDVIATVIELAAVRLGLGLQPARELGRQVAAAWSRNLSSITLTGSDARLMAVGGSLLVSDNRRVTDLDALVLGSLRCLDDGQKPVEIQSVRNLRWNQVRAEAGARVATAAGLIRYRCPGATLEGNLRVVLPFRELPANELELDAGRAQAIGDSMRDVSGLR